MHKLKRVLAMLLAMICMTNTCFTLVASADAAEEETSADDTSSSASADPVEEEAQESAENADNTEGTDAEIRDDSLKIDNAEQAIVEKFNDSQLEAYGIIANKFMTHQEVQAMKWNLIISQFAVPYRENIQDVLDDGIFKQMAEADGDGLEFSSNPYVSAVTDSISTGVASSTTLNEYLDAIIAGDGDKLDESLGVEKYNFKSIAETLKENGEVQYTMVYNSSTDDYAFVTDLFAKSEVNTIHFYIKDKIAFTGDAMEEDNIPAKLKAMNKQYLEDGENATKKKLAEDITAGCEVMDVQYPVYVNTNSTMMYNAIFVSNAIRMGAYGTYDKFMKSLGNSQLYMDRWGNLCAQARIDGVVKFVVVYPAYANPLFISTEIGDDDMAGYAYTDFNCVDFWQLYGAFKYSGGAVSNSNKNDDYADPGSTNWGNVAGNYAGFMDYYYSALHALARDENNTPDGSYDVDTFSVIGINAENVAKTYKDVKTYVGSKGWTADDVDKNTWYGGAVTDSEDTYLSYQDNIAYYNYTNDNGDKKTRTTFGGRDFTRQKKKYTYKNLIPILGVDTTNNMLFNKAIVSAYTRDSYNKAKENSDPNSGVSKQYNGSSSDAGWYNCFTDSNTTYSQSALSTYKANTNSTFGNNLVLDKYYPQAIWIGRNIGYTGEKFDKGWPAIKAYHTYDDRKHSYVLSIAGSHLRFSNWRGYDTNYCVQYDTLEKTTKIYRPTASARIRDTSVSVTAAMTQYPTMLYHSYRKGIYADKLSLQYSKQKIKNLGDIFEIDSWIKDAHVAVSFNFENMLSHQKEEYASNDVFGDKNIAIETVWNNMYADSDRFKTYITLNYTNNTVPNNSPLGNLLTSKNETGGREYTIVGLKDSIENTSLKGTVTGGRRYMSVPLLDSTLDYGQAYEIWKTGKNSSAVEIATSSIMTKPRTRTKAEYLYYGTSDSDCKNGIVRQDGFFSWYRCMAGNDLGSTWEGNPNVRALRLFMTDQRVSDLLENYPLEDFTLLSFVWLNYYIPQTPFNTKLNKMIVDTTEVPVEGEESEASSDSEEDSSEDSDDEEGEEEEEEEAKSSIIGDSSKKIFIGNNGGIFPDGTAITESSVYYGNKPNRNTLMWTTDLNDILQYTLTAGSDGTLAAGTANKLTTSHVYIETVSVNFGAYVLSINKNTQGDALKNIIENYEEDLGDISEEYTQSFLDKLLYFLEHPVISISNILFGFFQMIHNNIAIGNAGNVFDISWIVDWGIAKGFVKYYLAISGIWIAAMLVIRCVRYTFKKEATLGTLFKESAVCILLTTVPVVLLYLTSNIVHIMALYMTKDVSSNLVLIEIEKEVTSSESLNLNFESVYQMYREQFSGIDDNYVGLQLKIPTSWDATRNELAYGDANIKTLYNSISYADILAPSQTAAKLAEMSLNESDTNNADQESDPNKTGVYGLSGDFDEAIEKMTEVYLSEDQTSVSNATYMYYTHQCFIPVNYKRYSTSIFYYFYDYIKYQYLSYWANQGGSKSAAFADAAKQFSLPDYKHNELWSSYIARMWDAERGMLLKSYNGMYHMYHDDDYTYAKLYDSEGKAVYKGKYTTDMFGLSYLFNMNDDSYTAGKMGFPSTTYHNVVTGNYSGGDANNDREDDDFRKNTIETWAWATQDAFETYLNGLTSEDSDGNYVGYIKRTKEYMDSEVAGAYRTPLLKNFHPMAYIVDSVQWEGLTHATKLITDDPESSELNKIKFSPSYLEEHYGKKWYVDENDNRIYKDILSDRWINGGSEVSSYLSNSDLDLSNLAGQRMYGRVYASRSALYKHMFDGQKLITTETTPLEEKLMDLTDNIYTDVVKMTEYMQGDIRDSSLIFAAALAATFEFNKTFSGNPITGTQIEPQGLEPKTTDLDKYMRATFAENIDEIVKNTDVIYMIYDQDQGFLTALFVILSEVAILVTVITRCAILWAMFISAAYICLTFYFNPPYSRKSAAIGVVSQIASLLGGQFVIMFIITRSLRIVGSIDAGWGRVLVAILMFLVYVVVAIWNIKMLIALLKDMKNYGGAVISNAINNARMNYESKKSYVEAQALKMGKTALHAGNIGMKVATDTTSEGKADKVRNKRTRAAKRMEHSVEEDNPSGIEEIERRKRRKANQTNSSSNSEGERREPSRDNSSERRKESSSRKTKSERSTATSNAGEATTSNNTTTQTVKPKTERKKYKVRRETHSSSGPVKVKVKAKPAKK